MEIDLFTDDEKVSLHKVYELIVKIRDRSSSAFMSSLFLVMILGLTVFLLDMYCFKHAKFSFLGIGGSLPSASSYVLLYLSILIFLCGILTPLLFHLIFKPLNMLDEIKLREQEGIGEAFRKLYKIQDLLEILPETHGWIRSPLMKTDNEFIRKYFPRKSP